MPRQDRSETFYFFDFDDNTMFLQTKVALRNRETGDERLVSTHEFAGIRQMLGSPGEWEDFEIFEGTYRFFRDIPAGDLAEGMKQYFVTDIEEAIADKENLLWKAPSWDMFVHACERQRPLAIVTARGHSRETIKSGIKILVDAGLLPREPNYLAIYAVSNDAMRREILEAVEDPREREAVERMHDQTSALKRFAIWHTVEEALRQYGAEPPHRFGMSDDDPLNIDLIIKAMCDCKRRYPDKDFFAINTHKGEHVKLRIYPIDYAVTTEELEPGEVVG